MLQLNKGKLDLGKDAIGSSSLQADCWTIMPFAMAISTAKGMEKNMFYSFNLPATPSQLQSKLMAVKMETVGSTADCSLEN